MLLIKSRHTFKELLWLSHSSLDELAQTYIINDLVSLEILKKDKRGLYCAGSNKRPFTFTALLPMHFNKEQKIATLKLLTRLTQLRIFKIVWAVTSDDGTVLKTYKDLKQIPNQVHDVTKKMIDVYPLKNLKVLYRAAYGI